MGWNPVREAQKKAKEAVDKVIRPAVDGGKRTINKIGDEAENGVKKVGRSAENSVKKIGNDIEDNIKDIGNDIESNVKKIGHDVEEKLHKVGDEIEETLEERIPEKIEEFIDSAVAELAEAITREGLKKVRDVVKTTDRELSKLAINKPDLIDSINSLSVYVEIGPMTLNYSGFFTRVDNIAEILDKYVNEPPELSRRAIIEFVNAMGPTSVNMGLSIQVMALVVGSKELGIGGGLGDIELALFTELGDIILEKIGVPE